MRHDDEIADLLGAYALGMTTAEESAQVLRHLPTCPECRAELTRLHAAAGYLPLLVEERDPPPALRARLMSIVEQESRAARSGATITAVAEQGSGAGQPELVLPAARPVSPRRGWARVPRLVYGLAAALVVAAVVLVVVLVGRTPVTVHTYHGGAVAQVVHGIPLSGAAAAVQVRGDHTTDVQLTNIPALPAKLAYELWLIPTHGAPISLGGFEAAADHSFSHRYSRDAAGFAAVAVTIERAPGDWPTPTLPDLALEVKLSL